MAQPGKIYYGRNDYSWYDNRNQEMLGGANTAPAEQASSTTQLGGLGPVNSAPEPAAPADGGGSPDLSGQPGTGSQAGTEGAGQNAGGGAPVQEVSDPGPSAGGGDLAIDWSS